MAFLEPRGFALVNSDGVWLWDGADQFQSILTEVDGKRCILNDCIADPEGRLFTSSCFFDPNREDYELGFLIRVDTDGSAHIMEEGIKLSNGLAFSPDNSPLYHVDSGARTIYAYQYSRIEGTIRNRRTFVEVPADEGIPDGITVDSEGCVWCAHWFGGAIVRYRPDGSVDRKIRIPAAQTLLSRLVARILQTSLSRLPRSRMLCPWPRRVSIHIARVSGGQLFHLNLSIPGKPEYRVRISGLQARD